MFQIPYRTLVLTSAVISATVGCENPSRALKDLAKEARPSAIFNPLGFAADYLFSKAVDGIWDAVTGEPDVRELDRRLGELETRLSEHDPEMGNRIGDLRSQVDEQTSREDYDRLANQTLDSLADRVAALERQQAETSSRVDRLSEDADELDRELDRLNEKYRQELSREL